MVDQIRYADYALDGVKFTLTTDQDKVKLEQIEITRGENVVNVDGTYLLPEDFAAWQKQPLDVRLNVSHPGSERIRRRPQSAGAGAARPAQRQRQRAGTQRRVRRGI